MSKLPYFIELELTNRCQLSCIMCPHTIMTRKQGLMPFSTLKRAIDELKGYAKESYLHQIGEPLLHPQLVEMIDYVEDAQIRTSISTNCLLLDHTLSTKLLSSRLSEIILCIDSLNKETYEQIRRNSHFEQVMANALNFLNLKSKLNHSIQVIVQLIKMKENEKEWSHFADYFKNKVDKVWVKDYSTFAGKVTKGEVAKPRRFECAKPFTHLTIQWNGDCVTCCRDYDGITKMGNVNEQNIESIWNSERYNQFRQSFRTSNFCKEC